MRDVCCEMLVQKYKLKANLEDEFENLELFISNFVSVQLSSPTEVWEQETISTLIYIFINNPP